MEMEGRGAEGLAQGAHSNGSPASREARLSAPSAVLTWDVGPLTPTPSSPEDQVEMPLA